MKLINIIIGALLIILGIALISYYRKLKKTERGILSINLLVAGIGCLIIAIGLIIREL
jgi:hypothetical protein